MRYRRIYDYKSGVATPAQQKFHYQSYAWVVELRVGGDKSFSTYAGQLVEGGFGKSSLNDRGWSRQKKRVELSDLMG